jgi:hypothetical protein
MLYQVAHVVITVLYKVNNVSTNRAHRPLNMKCVISWSVVLDACVNGLQLDPEYRSSSFPPNVGKLLPDYTAPHPRRYAP